MIATSRPPRPLFLKACLVLGVAIASVARLSEAQQRTGPVQQWVAVVDKVRDSIVTIETQDALGTGFLVQSKGTLVTNNHVIKNAQQITVTLHSGDVYRSAYLLRADEEKDIAILRIEAADLPFVDLGNSDSIKVGEEVMAIGTPEGLEQTASTGIVSGVRSMAAGYRLIQTTAPISHGSSGGPLLNSDGRAIGIVTAFLREGQNLNFAVPVNYVRGMLDALALSPNNTSRLITSTKLATRDNVGAPPPKGVAVDLPPAPKIPLPKLPPPPATIWLYRTKSATDSMLNPTIYSRGRPLAILDKGQFFALSVPAGTYYFSFKDKEEGREAFVNVGAGEWAFFKVRYRQIRSVGPDEAMRDFKNLKPIEAANVRSSDVVATRAPFH